MCAVRDAINAGIVEGPRMLIAGFTTMTGSHLELIQPRAMVRWGFNTADGPWELRKLARKNMLAGCDVIKTCASGGGGTDKEEPDIRNMTQEELDAVVDEAHALHKHAAVHCFTTMTGSHLELIQPRAMYRWGFNTADGPWELRKLARKNMLAGCDVIKTCASGGGGTDKEEPDIRNMTQEELDAVVDEAHALHKHAAVHCFTTSAQRMALKAGADTIEHMVFHDDETIDLIRQGGVPVTPTLSHRTDHAIELRRNHGTADFVLRKMKYLQPFCFETFRKMYQAGVKIAMGTDMGFEPDMGSNAAELEIYVKLGMKPMDAILTTTRNAAQALKQEKDLGTIEAGKLADLIAVDGDPLKNIRCLQQKKNIAVVMKEGKIYADRRPGKSKNVVNVKPGDWKIVDYL